MQKLQERNIPWILLFALCLGICLRISYLYEIKDQPWFTNPLYDPQYNDYWAKGIATGDWTLPSYVNDPEIRTTPHGRPPGYPYLLSVIYLIFGRNPWAPRIIQYIFGIINIIIVWVLAKKYLGLRFADIIAILMATFWGFTYFESQLTYPVFAITSLLIWFSLLIKWQEKQENKIYSFLLGFTLGILALFRPNGLLLVLLFFSLLIFKFFSRKLSSSRLITLSFIFILGISIPIVPCFIRNYIVAHDFVFLSSYGGLNFYVGNHPESNGAEPRIPELNEWIGCDEWSCFDYPAIVRGLSKSLGKSSLSFSEANWYFYKSALYNIINNPKKWLVLTLKKVLLFWGPIEITNDTVPSWDKYESKTLNFLPGFPFYFALFITGIITFIFSNFYKLEHTTPQKIFLRTSLLIVFVYFLSVLPFFIASRYRIPIMPFILIVGTHSINEFINVIRKKDKFKFYSISVLLVISFAIGNINFTGYTPSKSVWLFRNGVSASLAGNDKKAKIYYKEALKNNPDNFFARINYSQVLGRTGRPSEGIYILTKNFSLPLASPMELNALGYLFEIMIEHSVFMPEL